MPEKTSPAVLGFHHVTASAGEPQRNLDFAFDDPGTHRAVPGP